MRLQFAMGEELLILNRMIKEGLTKKMTFDQKKFERNEAMSQAGREEGKTNAKTLRQAHICLVQEIVRKQQGRLNRWSNEDKPGNESQL